jgi:hypothetical protein
LFSSALIEKRRRNWTDKLGSTSVSALLAPPNRDALLLRLGRGLGLEASEPIGLPCRFALGRCAGAASTFIGRMDSSANGTSTELRARDLRQDAASEPAPLAGSTPTGD